MPKKRPIPKPTAVISGSAKRLTIQYAELLHLRQVVREAEMARRANPNLGPDLKPKKSSQTVD
jgi:hypothetical protein